MGIQPICRLRNGTCLTLALCIVFALSGCYSESAAPEQATLDVDRTILNEYDIVVANSEVALQMPAYVKHDPGSGHLFVYDHTQRTVLEIDGSQNIVRRYGGEGKGPGEIDVARNLFVHDSHLYVYDPSRYFIYRYQRAGTEIDSYNYGAAARETSPGEIPAPAASVLFTDLDNEMAVTRSGNILRPVHTSGEHLYERIDWEGRHLSWIGEVPEGYGTQLSTEEYRKAVEAGEAPAHHRHRAFPVMDRSDPGSLFMVYSTIPKVAKFDTSGRLLWERRLPHTPAVDSVHQQLLEPLRARDFRQQIPIRKYFSGFTTPAGELYLVVFNEMVRSGITPVPTIHRFNTEGKLVGRYTFANEEEAYLLPHLAVDPENNRFLVISLKDAEIRAYPFQ